jgi:hypothetical protein
VIADTTVVDEIVGRALAQLQAKDTSAAGGPQRRRSRRRSESSIRSSHTSRRRWRPAGTWRGSWARSGPGSSSGRRCDSRLDG